MNAMMTMNALVPTSVGEAESLARVLSTAKLVPAHLRNSPGDCLLVVMQAQRWGMDALSVAQCTSVVRDKLCYEGKLVAAVLYSMGVLESRLRYEYSGQGDRRSVKVIGRLRGENEDRAIEGTVASWATDNGNWKKSPDDMLAYRGARQWARRHAPETLLGVYSPDEIEDPNVITGTATEVKPAATDLMPKAKAAQVIEHQQSAGQADAVEGEFVEAEQQQEGTGLSELSPGQKSTVLRWANQAGLNEDELLVKFPTIDGKNINEVLKALRKLAEGAGA
jgi:hypothetical protein